MLFRSAQVKTEADIPAPSSNLYPGILKVARFGYDGKGQARVNSPEEAIAAFNSFNHELCVLEQRVSLDTEVSVVLARDSAGKVAAFPTAENTHRNGILDISIVPARCNADLREKAQKLAAQVAEKLGYIGTLGVEFFVSNGQLLINEMAQIGRAHV